tara:strand:- start:122 stop:1810 length:1689 start_codon:yes stop_codon:yes gene_type:complete
MGSTSTQETKMPQWQEDFIRENILPLGEQIGNKEYTPYEGDMIAGMSNLQNQALSGFGNLDMGGQAYQDAMTAQQGLTSFNPNAMGAAQIGPASTMGAAQIGPASTMGAAQLGQAATMQAAQLGDAERFSAAQLGDAERMQGVGAVRSAAAPGQIDVNQLATTNLDAYMSPYTQNVINRSLQTLGSAQEQSLNKLGAQATAAGAFGGSRQGIAEAGTREAYGKQAADLIAGMSEKAYTQALQSGQFDIGNVQQARALSSGQEMTAETLGQQAREAGAQRDQAARSGNMAAANQFASQQAQLQQAATQANAQAANQFASQQAQMQQAANSANMAAQNQFTSQQAQLQQQAASGNMDAINQIASQQAQLQQSAASGNMGAINQIASQQAQLQQSAASGNMDAINQIASQQAQLQQSAASGNMDAINQLASQQAQMEQAANAANYQGQFSAAGIQGGAANAMAGLAGDQLQSQMAGLGAQMSVGDQQRALEQAQLQANYAAFQQQQNYPLTQLSGLLSAGSGVPSGLGTVTTQDPFGGLRALGGVMSGAGAIGQGGGIRNLWGQG